MSFGERLDRLLAERGISGRELARRIPCDRSYISRLVRGLRHPSPEMAAMIDRQLGAGGELAALAGEPRRRDVLAGGAAAAAALAGGSLDRLAWAQRHPRRIDAGAVSALAAVLASLRRMEDALGAVAVAGTAAAQLAAVEDLAGQAQGAVRRDVLEVAAQVAQFAAYLHRDRGDAAGDRERSAQALEWATEAGDAGMIATVLVNRGTAALLAGQPGAAVGLAQAAQRDRSVPVGQLAYGADLEARGHVIAGDWPAAERKLREAEDLAAALEDRPQDRRPWSYWMSTRWFQCQRGATLGWLAAEPRFYALAVAELEAGYTAMPEDERLSGWGGMFLAHLASAHSRGGELEAACGAGLQAASIARHSGSVRLAGMLDGVRAGLSARWPGDPRVGGLADALA